MSVITKILVIGGLVIKCSTPYYSTENGTNTYLPVIDINYEVTQNYNDETAIKEYINEKIHNLNAETFIEVASEYELDYSFMLSTFILETGWGQSHLWVAHNNPAGLKNMNSTVVHEHNEFSSQTTGLKALFDNTLNYTSGTISWIGTRTTIKEIRDKWSALKDENRIVDLMLDIREYERSYLNESE